MVLLLQLLLPEEVAVCLMVAQPDVALMGAREVVPRQDLAAQVVALAVLLFLRLLRLLRLLHLQCILVLRLLRLLLLTILDREVRLRDLACEVMTGVNIGLTLVS